MAAQDSIDAAVTALKALVADITANPKVDTTALDAAVADANKVLEPAAPAPAPQTGAPGSPVLNADGSPKLDANGNPEVFDADGNAPA